MSKSRINGGLLKLIALAMPRRLCASFSKIRFKLLPVRDANRRARSSNDQTLNCRRLPGMHYAAKTMTRSEAAVADAAEFLRSRGIRLPRFKLTADGARLLGGSHANVNKPYSLNMGTYPTRFLRRWFAMHELGHLLWAEHDPLRNEGFRKHFGEPMPENYDSLPVKHSWKTAGTGPLSRFAGWHRPKGQPSWYGSAAGGEERFCELLAMMYANYGGFDGPPPSDLEGLWNGCLKYGLSRMA